MTSEKGFAAYNLLGRVADDLIMDALLPEDRGAAPVKMKKERPRLLSFLESGWGVAIICALVAVSVMGGIIWAGNRSGMSIPPAGTMESENDPVTQEIFMDDSEESPTETSEPETVFVPTETTRSCTLRTDKDRYEWGEERLGTFTVNLTCTVAGAVLDISPYDFELVNLTTGKQATMGFIKITDHLDKTKAYPTAPDAFAQRSKTLCFDWKTTPPGRYRLTYTGVDLSEGEEYPYYDFEILDLDVYAFAYDDAEHKIPLDKRACWEEKVWDEMAGEMVDVDVDAYFYIREAASELPVVTAREGNGCAIVGVEVRRYYLYDQDFNLLYSGREWSNPVEAGMGTFYVEIEGYKYGNYIPEADDYEDGIYTYAFRLEVLPDRDDSGAETELPYFEETTPTD